MDKKKELNAYEQMAVWCNKWFSCGTCPYNPLANKESICPNFDKKLVYAMGKGYRKIPEGAVVLTNEELATVHEQFAQAMYQKEVNTRKETAELFAEMLKARLEERKKLCLERWERYEDEGEGELACYWNGKENEIHCVKADIYEICKEITEVE